MTKILIAMCMAAADLAAQSTTATPLMTQELAGLPDKEAMMITVEYAPGASTPEHRHNAHTFVYVLREPLSWR